MYINGERLGHGDWLRTTVLVFFWRFMINTTIQFNHLTYQYDTQETPVFDDLTLSIHTDWKCALVARNGRGKSTLLKLIAKKLQATDGQVKTVDECGYFPLNISDPSLYPAALFDIEPEDQWKVEREMRQLHLHPDKWWQPFEQLSGGEQVKVMLAFLFSQSFDYIVLDEPTIYLDATTRHLIHDYLKQKKIGFLIVSHDRTFLEGLVDHVVGIEAHSVDVIQGGYQQYYEEKANKDRYYTQQNAKIKQEIKRLQQSAEEKSQWSSQKEKEKWGNPHVKKSKNHLDKGFLGARAARTMKRVRHMERQIEKQISEKQALINNVDHVEVLTMPTPLYRYHPVYEVDKLMLSFDNTALFEPITFKIEPKDCLVISGDNGSGKSTLLSYITGQFNGDVQVEFESRHPITMSYLSQFFEFDGTIEALAETYHLDYQQVIYNVRQLGMERKTLSHPIASMSSGERQKVAIAASLCQPADLYIWDEPLTYLDIQNQDQLVALIQTYQPTLLLVDHNDDFVQQIKTKEVRLKAIN